MEKLLEGSRRVFGFSSLPWTSPALPRSIWFAAAYAIDEFEVHLSGLMPSRSTPSRTTARVVVFPAPATPSKPIIFSRLRNTSSTACR